MIKLSSLRWSDYSRLLGGALCNHRGPYKRDIGGLYSECDIFREASLLQSEKFEDTAQLALKMEEENIQAREFRWPLESLSRSLASLMLELSPLTLC